MQYLRSEQKFFLEEIHPFSLKYDYLLCNFGWCGGCDGFYLYDVFDTEEGPVFDDNIFDEEGKITGEKGDPRLYPADSTIIAVSQGPKSKLVDTTKGLKAAPSGLLLTDQDGETTIPGIFAAGDVVLGAKTVVEAVRYAKIVAESMDEYIKSLPEENN